MPKKSKKIRNKAGKHKNLGELFSKIEKDEKEIKEVEEITFQKLKEQNKKK